MNIQALLCYPLLSLPGPGCVGAACVWESVRVRCRHCTMAGWWLLSSAGEMVASSPSPCPGSPPPSTSTHRYTRGTIGDGLGLSYLEYILEYLLLHMIKFIKFIDIYYLSITIIYNIQPHRM